MKADETQAESGFLPDNEINNAVKFGFGDYSKTLASVISDEGLQTPFVIAVHGEWGSGKSSLMKTIAKQLGSLKEHKVKTIWFNAWEFEKLSVPLWAVFINRVLIELQEMTNDNELKSKLRRIGKNIFSFSGDILLRNVKFMDTDLKDICDKLQQNIISDIERIDCLKDNLQSYIEEAIAKDSKKRTRIAIFVDDVDRCLPEQTIEIF